MLIRQLLAIFVCANAACSLVVSPRVASDAGSDGSPDADQIEFEFSDDFADGLSTKWDPVLVASGMCTASGSSLSCATDTADSDSFAYYSAPLPALTSFYVRVDLQIAAIAAGPDNFVVPLRLADDDVALNVYLDDELRAGLLAGPLASPPGSPTCFLANADTLYPTYEVFRIDIVAKNIDSSSGSVLLAINGAPLVELKETSAPPVQALQVGVPNQGVTGAGNRVNVESVAITTSAFPDSPGPGETTPAISCR